MFRLGSSLVAEATYLIYTLAMSITLSITKELDPDHVWRDILRLSPFLSGYSGELRFNYYMPRIHVPFRVLKVLQDPSALPQFMIIEPIAFGHPAFFHMKI